VPGAGCGAAPNLLPALSYPYFSLSCTFRNVWPQLGYQIALAFDHTGTTDIHKRKYSRYLPVKWRRRLFSVNCRSRTHVLQAADQCILDHDRLFVLPVSLVPRARGQRPPSRRISAQVALNCETASSSEPLRSLLGVPRRLMKAGRLNSDVKWMRQPHQGGRHPRKTPRQRSKPPLKPKAVTRSTLIGRSAPCCPPLVSTSSEDYWKSRTERSSSCWLTTIRRNSRVTSLLSRCPCSSSLKTCAGKKSLYHSTHVLGGGRCIPLRTRSPCGCSVAPRKLDAVDGPDAWTDQAIRLCGLALPMCVRYARPPLIMARCLDLLKPAPPMDAPAVLGE